MFTTTTTGLFAPVVSSMGGASSAPTGSIAYLAEPFSLRFAGIDKQVSQFKKYSTGRWGSYPGNDWSVADLSELIARGATIERVTTPEGATASIPVDPRPVQTMSGPDYTQPDTSDITDAQGEPTPAKKSRALAWLAAGLVALAAVFTIGRATRK